MNITIACTLNGLSLPYEIAKQRHSPLYYSINWATLFELCMIYLYRIDLHFCLKSACILFTTILKVNKMMIVLNNSVFIALRWSHLIFLFFSSSLCVLSTPVAFPLFFLGMRIACPRYFKSKAGVRTWGSQLNLHLLVSSFTSNFASLNPEHL